MHDLRFPRGDPKTIFADADPGHKARAMGTLAHCAVAMPSEQRRQLEFERDGAAKAAPGYGGRVHLNNLSMASCQCNVV